MNIALSYDFLDCSNNPATKKGRFFELLKNSGSDPLLTIEGHSREAIEKSLTMLPKYL